tara:strand:+ start:201 stop:698 length:498 start_codon:yes stop_codon:yes gene_type:complete
MNYLKISVGILLALSLSRFIPHPPNFTSLLALSFYVPIIFGKKFIPAVILSFAITDYIIGYHSLTHWTWGSVVIIGLISQYFKNSIYKRVGGALSGALIFFIITNFGVWVNGSYGYSFNGLLSCYTLAIPFFTYSLISTFIFSGIIEALIKIKFFKFNHKYFEKI